MVILALFAIFPNHDFLRKLLKNSPFGKGGQGDLKNIK